MCGPGPPWYESCSVILLRSEPPRNPITARFCSAWSVSTISIVIFYWHTRSDASTLSYEVHHSPGAGL
jgi:hypothetical protein